MTILREQHLFLRVIQLNWNIKVKSAHNDKYTHITAGVKPDRPGKIRAIRPVTDNGYS